MKTPILDKIQKFYESIPAFNISYTLTLVEDTKGLVYQSSDNTPALDCTDIEGLNGSVIDLVKASLHRQIEGCVNVENSMRRFKDRAINEVFHKMHHSNMRCKKSILENKKQAAEDCTAFLVYERTLQPEMRTHLLKSIIKKYKDPQ